jgi:hypothetical protein
MEKILITSILFCAFLAIAGCDKRKETTTLEPTTPVVTTPEIPPIETVNLIREHLENHPLLKTYVWLYQTTFTAEGSYSAVIDFPENARYAPTYPQLLALCPNPTESNFWNQPAAKPFLIYLTRLGSEKAMQIARCTKDMTHPSNRKVPKPDTPPAIYPPENADLVLLKKEAAEGSPSFNDAKEALKTYNKNLLLRYLIKRPELASLYDETGRTLLFYEHGIDQIIILIAFGAEPNIQLRNGDSILTEVTGSSEFSSVKKFVELGANPKYCKPEHSFRPESAEFLLEHGAPISPDALENAMGNGKYEIAEILYKHGARFETDEFYKKYGLQPLHQKIKYVLSRNDDIPALMKEVELYIRYTENIQAVDKSGLTALEFTDINEGIAKEQIIKLLRKRIAEDRAKKEGR